MTMKGIYSLAVVLVLLVIVQGSWQLPVLETADSSSSLESVDEEPSVTSDMDKRHSEGTFSNDYSKYLEDQRAQEFVRWLMANSKRSGAAEKRHADGTFTSDASSFRRDQAVQDFVAMLKSGQVKRESDMMDRSSEGFSQKRQVDGTFTSDVNKVLDSMAAKEYLLWVMSHPSGESKKRQESH